MAYFSRHASEQGVLAFDDHADRTARMLGSLFIYNRCTLVPGIEYGTGIYNYTGMVQVPVDHGDGR